MTVERAELIAKLEAVHSFPCAYPFKLIGTNTPDLLDAALAALRNVFPEVAPEISRRESEHGRHQSITLVIPVPNAESVILLYERFRGLAGIHMLL